MSKKEVEATTDEILEQRKYNRDYTPPKDVIYMTIRGEVIAPASSYVVFSGLPKQGKSVFVSATIASWLKRAPVFNIQLRLPDMMNKVVLFDTEQSENNFYKGIENIKRLSTLEDVTPLLEAYRLRGFGATKIKEIIEAYIKVNPNCKCCVIDGLLDLIDNFNDVTESKHLADWLKRITEEYNVFVIVVIHLGKKDSNTLGHVGSMADRYANSTLKVEKNNKDKTIELTPVFLRSAGEFDTISLKYFDTIGGFAEVDTEQPVQPFTYKQWNFMQLKQFASSMMPEAGEPYKNIISHIKELQNIGENAAKGIMKRLIEEKILYKKNMIYYYQP